jgi:ribosomal protein S10
MATMFLFNKEEMRKSYRETSIEDSCKILLYLAKWFQRRRLSEIKLPEARLAYGDHFCKRIGTKHSETHYENITHKRKHL